MKTILPPVDAVLFDLDGTLVDTLGDLTAATAAATAAFGHRTLSAEEVRGCVGSGVHALVERVLQVASGQRTTASHAQAALEIFRAAYDECNGRHSRLYPGVAWALKRLHAMDLRIAMVTNKPTRFVQPLLLRHGIRGAFDAIVAGDSTSHLKPEPEPILRACELLGVAPQRALMVGDSLVDVVAARSAGCAIACVAGGYAAEGDLAGIAVPLLDGVEALPDLLARPVTRFPSRTTSRRP